MLLRERFILPSREGEEVRVRVGGKIMTLSEIREQIALVEELERREDAGEWGLLGAGGRIALSAMRATVSRGEGLAREAAKKAEEKEGGNKAPCGAENSETANP
jgi:hypothetical protein